MPDLSELLCPASVAVIGASPDLAGLRGRTLKMMLRHPYRGRIYPVSRSHASVQGLQAYPSIDKLPERVDLAVLIVPARFVPDELERCGRAGMKAALILASGFAEDGSEAGAALQGRVAGSARRYDMAVCGPNAEGFANLASGLCATFSPVLEESDGSVVDTDIQRRIAVVSQSGGIGFSFLDRGRPKGLAFSHVVSTGNEACLECFDIVEHLLDEGSADVFVVFLEAIRNARTFRRAAEKALAAGKPIVVAKIGESESGRRAAASHTAALAGAGASYRAMFRRYGVIEGADTDEILDIAAAFTCFGKRLPARPARGHRHGLGRRRRLDGRRLRRGRTAGARARARGAQAHRRAPALLRHLAEPGRRHRAGDPHHRLLRARAPGEPVRARRRGDRGGHGAQRRSVPARARKPRPPRTRDPQADPDVVLHGSERGDGSNRGRGRFPALHRHAQLRSRACGARRIRGSQREICSSFRFFRFFGDEQHKNASASQPAPRCANTRRRRC